MVDHGRKTADVAEPVLVVPLPGGARMEVRAVGRQEPDMRASLLDQFNGVAVFVKGEIVEDHNVAAA